MPELEISEADGEEIYEQNTPHAYSWMDGDQSQWGVMHHTEQDHGHLVQPAVVPGRVCIGCLAHGWVAVHLRLVHSEGCGLDVLSACCSTSEDGEQRFVC